MATEVILPKVDMDMATGRISKWFFADGASVKKGDVLFEIETDKAAMEIDAPASGILRDITGAEGIDIAVGSAVAWIYGQGEAYAGPAAHAGGNGAIEASGDGAKANAVAPDRTAPSDDSALTNGLAIGGDVRATPLARRAAREAGIALNSVRGSGPNGRILRGDVAAYLAVAHTPTRDPAAQLAAGAAATAQADPVAPQSIGRISAAAGSQAQGAAAKLATATQPATVEAILKLFPKGSFENVAHTTMRRTIARRLVEAKSTVPHFYLSIDCNIEPLLKLRTELNASAPTIDSKPAYRLSVNDMVIKAYALALAAVPDANVSWTDDVLLKHRHADIGVAVSVPGGLITPIVRHAEAKTLSAISKEMKDLGIRAKNGKLRPDEYQGGTTAISNLGMFGIRDFAAIVNPPHATILAVGVGERRAIVTGDIVVPATLMTVTLSTDHRAVDGALAATLIGAFRAFIETPMTMLV